MDTKLFSSILSSANNIAGPKRTLSKRSKDYESFITFLEKSNKDLIKIKLPTKKKVETLASNLSFDIAAGGGEGGINFGDILKNLAIGGAEGLGIRALLKKFRGGKPTTKIAEEGENIFSKVAKVGQKAEPAGVKAANKIVGFDRKALGKGAAEVGTKEGGKIATQAAEKGAAEVGAKTGGKLVSRALPVIGAVFSTISAIDDIKQGNWAGAGLNAVSAIADIFGQSEISLATAAGAIGTELTYKGGEKDKNEGKSKIDVRLKEQEKKQREAADKKVSFADITNKFDRVVSKFEKFAKGFGGPGSSDQQQKESEMSEKEKEKTAHEAPEETPPPSPTLTGSPGHEFEPKIKQYITGDPNDRDYMADHGTESNYHDHIAFKDRATAENAFNFFKSKGFKVTEFKGYTSVGGHKGPDHYSGLAFDIPGYQWGGKGKIGPTEYQGSEKVRSALNEFFNIKPSNKKGSQTPTPVAPEKGTDVFNKLTKAKPGSGETIKVPGVGSVVMGRNLFQQAEKKYFTEKGEQITDPKKIKGFENQLDAFFKNSRDYELAQAQIRAQARGQLPSEIASPPPSADAGSSLVLVDNGSQAAPAQSGIVPIPIPMGGGGGGGGSMGGAGLSAGEVVNSFAKLILLTNLSGS